jgi:hypothetical protein
MSRSEFRGVITVRQSGGRERDLLRSVASSCVPVRNPAGPAGVCKVSVQVLSAFFDRELPLRTHMAVASHAGRCARCAQVLEEFHTLRSLLRSVSIRSIQAHEIRGAVAPELDCGSGGPGQALKCFRRRPATAASLADTLRDDITMLEAAVGQDSVGSDRRDTSPRAAGRPAFRSARRDADDGPSSSAGPKRLLIRCSRPFTGTESAVPSFAARVGGCSRDTYHPLSSPFSSYPQPRLGRNRLQEQCVTRRALPWIG